jgi:hypothetical protein
MTNTPNSAELLDEIATGICLTLQNGGYEVEDIASADPVILNIYQPGNQRQYLCTLTVSRTP